MNDSEIKWLASFDIGKKNFSFYIEELDTSILTGLVDLPKRSRYVADGSPAADFAELLREVCTAGKRILLENTDLTTGCDPSAYLDIEVFHNMTKLLDSYKEYWDQCDIILLEKQMSFGKRHNTMALKLGQHCWSYFALRYGREKELIEFPAYHKTQVLGAAKKRSVTKKGLVRYKAIDKPARKKWCIAKGLEILDDRGDEEGANLVRGSKKKDDMCDVICQLQAFKYLRFVAQ